jgi:peroxiredoxin
MSYLRKWLRPAVLISLLLLCAQAALHSQQMRIGSHVPTFKLDNVQGRTQTIHAGGGRITAVLFFSTRCPLSNAFNYRRGVLYHDFRSRVRFLLVDPNANESPGELRAYAKQSGLDLPVYRDVDGKVADLLAIRATTDSLVIDRDGLVRYRGNIENAPNPERATQHGLRAALEAVVAGQPVKDAETRAMGCAVRRLHPVPQTVSLP